MTVIVHDAKFQLLCLTFVASTYTDNEVFPIYSTSHCFFSYLRQ